ncbi:MAG: hypothetical protein ACRDBQ_22270 [Shewanella sp.]
MTQRVVNYKYSTGNPVLPNGSIDVRDGIDNNQSFDVFMNAPEDTYNQRDGKVVKTVAGMNNEFDAQILNMGFTRVGTFKAGATLTNTRQTLLWDVADGGDGQEYGWSGTFPKIVPANSAPDITGGISVGAWISRFDPELHIQVRDVQRRSYAEAGYNLVAGSFETGGTLVSVNDVLLHEASGKAFTGPAGTVAAGTNPGAGSFVDRSPVAGFSHALQYGPASAGYRLKFTTYVTDGPYLADPTGVVPFRQAAQSAIDAVSASGGGVVVIPTGNFLMDSTPIIPRNNVRVLGFGDTSRIVVNTDMRVFEFIAPSVSSVLFGFELENLFIDNTVTGTRTKYDVYIENPNFCRFTKVHIRSGHDDTQYSNTNVGGIHLKKSTGSTTTTFCNWIDDCWMQNNSVWLDDLTDSRVKGGYVWGHTRQFAIRVTGGGANAIDSVMGIIPSKFNGGIWLDGIDVNQMRIINNEFDGNPLLDTGAGIYAPQQVLTTTVQGNTFWGCDKQGIHLVDPVGWTVVGNNFWKCNAADAGYDDILVEGRAFAPTSNTFSGNSHVIDDPRTNKGRAYRELNSGFSPVLNSVTGAGIAGGYLDPAILAPGVPGQETNIDNCVGGGMTGVTKKPNNVRTTRSVMRSAEGIIAPGGTLTLPINTEAQSGSMGGYTGMVSVSTTRQNFIAQSTSETMAVASRGLTLNKNVLTTIGGSSGNSAYTLSVTTPGNLVFTNTSTETVDARISFDGVMSLA